MTVSSADTPVITVSSGTITPFTGPAVPANSQGIAAVLRANLGV